MRSLLCLLAIVALAAAKYPTEEEVAQAFNIANLKINKVEMKKAHVRKPSVRSADPEVDMTGTQIIQHWGYPAEIFTVTTDDGYVLEMHRIKYGRSGPGAGDPCRPVVFMQHGLECDSTNWIVNLPDESAGYIFADAGFDVWLGNMRGNTYSKGHTTLNPSHEKYWEFSWDEMSQKDLEYMINKVLEVTGQKSLYYIGHSQGTLTLFAKLSDDPAFAPKIKQFFALAPVGTVKHIKGLLKFLADWFLPFLDIWYDIFGSGEFLPNNWIMDELAKLLCDSGIGPHGGVQFRDRRIGQDLCDDVLFLIAGPESDQFNKTRDPVYISHTPAGTSTQNIMHWAQMVKSGTVARYDWGSAHANQQHYGVSKPPSYDFAKIKTDMYLYWSDDDWLADPTDVKDYLLSTLNPNYVKENKHLSGYNHLDYIWGMNAPKDIYHPIVDIIKNDLGGSVKCPAVKGYNVRGRRGPKL